MSVFISPSSLPENINQWLTQHQTNVDQKMLPSMPHIKKCRLWLEPPSCWVYSGKMAATSGSPSVTRSTRRRATIWTWTTPMLTLSTIAEKITYATISLVSFCECWPYRDAGVQSPKSKKSMAIAMFWRCDDVYQPGVELFMRTVGGSCKNITKVICKRKKGCLFIHHWTCPLPEHPYHHRHHLDNNKFTVYAAKEDSLFCSNNNTLMTIATLGQHFDYCLQLSFDFLW